eukprot:Gb_06668 [translate_table: standard]
MIISTACLEYTFYIYFKDWNNFEIKKKIGIVFSGAQLLPGHATERRERAIGDNNLGAISGKDYHESRYNGVGNV